MNELVKAKENIPLKISENKIGMKNPWNDDKLKREQFSDSLTNLVRNQKEPFVISLNGDWGTGKTFFLKRWSQDLKNQGFESIYFNAWEDDFCDDPFVAIIGQLSDYFKDHKEALKKKAMPLMKQVVFDVLKNISGIDMSKIAELIQDNVFKQYSDQRAAKDELKKYLEEIAGKVADDSGEPLVFIIDELDRCRPTFAIELLERIKHIFDIPNMVFVLGVNREELGRSIKSVYGEIDANVYLRRFFDMELMLPRQDTREFCEYLIHRYKLKEIFSNLSQSMTYYLQGIYITDFTRYFVDFCSGFALSLRDLDYCIRLMAVVSKNRVNMPDLYPFLIVPLILLRVKNPTLYKKFVAGEARASKVIDYFYESLAHDAKTDEIIKQLLLPYIEYALYLTNSGDPENIALEQLDLMLDDKELTHPEYLSAMIRESLSDDKTRVIEIVAKIKKHLLKISYHNASKTTLSHISGLIDFAHDVVPKL